MRITEKEQETRKKRMLHVAYDFFCEYGIDGTSIAQIAKAADVSPKSIFRYFDNKAELVQSTQFLLWAEVMGHIAVSSRQDLLHAKTGLEELDVLLTHCRSLYEEHSRYLLFACDYKLFLFRQHIQLSEELYRKIINPVFDTFSSALARGRADGSICNKETIDTQFFTMWGVLRSFVEQIVVYDQIYSGKNPWKGQFPLLLHYILNSLRTSL